MNYLSCILRLIMCLCLGFASIPAMADDEMAAREERIAAAKEAAAKKKAAKEEEEAAKEEAAKEEVLRIRKANLKKGTLSVTSFDDAILFYEPKDLWGVMKSPLLVPDKSIYSGIVVLDEQENKNTLLVKAILAKVNDDVYATLKLTKKTVNYSQEGLRIGGFIKMIGRYVKNQKYTTNFGGVKTVPVFEVMYIGDSDPMEALDSIRK